MTHPISPIDQLFRACEPNESLPPEDPRLVDFDLARGESPAPSYARALRRANPTRPEIKLFAGHRGIGKTSELLRLKQLLELPASDKNPYPPFLVLYFDVSQTLDINDLDLPDLLVFVAGEVQKQLHAAAIPEFSTSTQYLSRVWEDIKGALGATVDIKDAGLKTPFGSLAVEFKNRPNARKDLREAIERHSTSLFLAVNDMLTQANVALRSGGAKSGLVLLIDGLDKLVLRPLDNGTSNTHIRLFCDRAEQLAALQAHTVYTIPISLFYSPRLAQLEQTFGAHTEPLPMIGLRGPGKSEPTPSTTGMTKLWEMLEKRCTHAGLSTTAVFDEPSTAHHLCRMTGGHPRHLMMFMQAALIAVDQLPITKAAAAKAVQNYADALLREIPDEFWPHLRKFAEPQAYIPKDERHQQMLFYLHVFEYLNDEPWYEVNPVIRELSKFKRAD
jgi:hypothetical protein